MRRATRCRESTIRPSRAFSSPQSCTERSSKSDGSSFCPEKHWWKKDQWTICCELNLCCEHLELKLGVDRGSCPFVERNLLLVIGDDLYNDVGLLLVMIFAMMWDYYRWWSLQWCDIMMMTTFEPGSHEVGGRGEAHFQAGRQGRPF